ncbi:MAG TPA: hypothetical protein ENN87_12410, partial [Phycisphaerales bacterium]|nr:hypothetical protein [Phycisphaerales bacterium]
MACVLFAALSAGPAKAQQTVFKLDVNRRAENSPATTEDGFTAFTLAGNPATVNGVTVFFEGNLDDRRRDVPTGIDLEQVLRDFIFGNVSDVQITLSGLQPGIAYTVIMYAFDTSSAGPRHAVWTANGAPLFETFFNGAVSPASADDCKYEGQAVSDAAGTIVLQSARGANDGGPHWAFVNALILDVENPCYNVPPSIHAPEVMVVVPNTAVLLDVAVTDDGKPYIEGCDPDDPAVGTPYGLAFLWSQESGPAPVGFDPESADVQCPQATFPLPGTYELLLEVTDGPVAEGPQSGKRTRFRMTVEAVRPVIGDVDGNGVVDLQDLRILAGQWLGSPPFPEGYSADLDGDGRVTADDLGLLAANWLYEASPLVISEFVASNRQSLLDGDGQASDWIELHNPGDQAVSLDGWHMTDDRDVLRKWPFPAQAVLPAGGYLVLFASDQPTHDYVDSKGYLHTNFALAREGEYLALVGPGGRIVHEYAPSYPPQQTDISYGMWHTLFRYFATPTPGLPNRDPFLGFTEKTSHSVQRGFHDVPFALHITCGTPEAIIRYTLDGSEPTEQHGRLYDPALPPTIDTTVTVRSVAIKPGLRPGPVTTHTYVFVDAVAAQPAAPPGWPTDWGWCTDESGTTHVRPADYEMDPRVVDNTLPGYSIRDALLDIPSVSIAMAPDDFISRTTGIYANPLSRWERKCSVEYLLPDGTQGFQHDCKIEVHGNASRRPYRMQKHSLRLTFTRVYGPAKLKYPLFPASAVEEFNQLVLRACFTDSWGLVSWMPTRYRPNDSQYIRDVWMKQSLRDMGQPSSHGRFVHLYVNGLYFGVHDLTERLKDDFFADHLGGRPEDWQINADFATPPGRWGTMMSIDPSTLDGYLQIQEYLDVENFADYILLHLYADAEDWPHHNGYAAVNAISGDGRFRFFVWDQEIVLDWHGRGASRINSTGGVGGLFQKMRTNEEFRVLFGDRVYKHCFNNGALSITASQERYRRIADAIDKAIVAESARWGDVQMSTPYGNTIQQPSPLDDVNHYLYPPAPNGPDYYFTREQSWVVERDNVIENYIPAIHDAANSYALINVLRAANLYPSFDPPVFLVNGAGQYGGYAATGDVLSMTAAHPVWYTQDGTD